MKLLEEPGRGPRLDVRAGESPNPFVNGPIPLGNLPVHVAVRIRSHGLNMDRIGTSGTGKRDTYVMKHYKSHNGYTDNLRKFTRVIDVLEHAFPGAEIKDMVRPAHDKDPNWRVEFTFSRTPEQAALDGYVFAASNDLYNCTRMEGDMVALRRQGVLDQRMTSCGAMLHRCSTRTGDPVFGLAHRTLQGFWRDTPRAKGKQDAFAGQDGSVGQIDDVVCYARAMLQEMLDSGGIMDTTRPPPPVDAEDERELGRLMWARAVCRTALFLFEEDDFHTVGRGLFNDLKQTARLLGELAQELDEPVLLQGREALILAAAHVLDVYREKDPEVVPVRGDTPMTELSSVLRRSARILLEEAMVVAPDQELDDGEDAESLGASGPLIPGFSR